MYMYHVYVCMGVPPGAVVFHPHHGKSISEQCALSKQLLSIEQTQRRYRLLQLTSQGILYHII